MERGKLKNRNQEKKYEKADPVEIIYYTDPLCCWSWAMEPQLQQLKSEYSGQINWRYCMGGLLPGWKNYHDEINDVSRPIQMGPVWMHAQQISGITMNSTIWMKDPPASSYPSCIAVKCAFLQSQEAGEKYLLLLREALMLHGKNIAKGIVLVKIAGELSKKLLYNFDVNKFKEDMKNDNGLEAFRKDLQEIQYKNIKRFPTMIIKSEHAQGIVVTGFRPYSVLLEALMQIASVPAKEPGNN
ncbi:MAG TPA: DsbA family protein [Hanamia sp.]